MNYQETIQWLFNQLPMYQRVGKAAYKADLDTTINLLEAINNPQNKFKALHIAGTNGKGSLAHQISSILQEAGYKTGLYTSPHLSDFRERIRVNGEMVEKEFVTDFVNNNHKILHNIKPSFFEMTVAMAYDYFASQNVDIAVLETGMGGRLDSTNVCNPIITAITNIGLDHTMFLGNTIEKIAVEKAGIIKPNTPVVIGRRQNETTKIFNDTAKHKNAEITFAEDEISIKTLNTPLQFKKNFDIWYNNELLAENASSPLAADYQTENICTAIVLAIKLKEKGFSISIENILDGLENVISNTSLRGRWHKINDMPLTICDTGHNTDGIQAVVSQIKQMNYDNLHIIFGMVNDKEPYDILSLLPKNATYYFCKPDIPRGMNEELLAEHAFKAGLNGKTHSSVMEAYNSARNNSSPNDLIFIGGSTFVVAEII